MKTKYCEDECPYCGSTDIDFDFVDLFDVDGDGYKTEIWECVSCEREFTKVYNISVEYFETEYKEIPLDEKTLFDKPES